MPKGIRSRDLMVTHRRALTPAEIAAKEKRDRELMPPPKFLPIKKRRMEASFSSLMQELADIKVTPIDEFESELDVIEAMMEGNVNEKTPWDYVKALGIYGLREDDVLALLDNPPPWVSKVAAKVRRDDWRAGALRSDYVVQKTLQRV